MDEPDGAGAHRLSRALRDRSETYSARLALDVALVVALLRSGHLAAARRALDEHRASLLAYATELERAVADAVVEREAEAVVASAVTVDAEQPGVAGVHSPPRRLRRALASSLAAAAFAAVILVPQLRLPPPGLDATVETAARRELIDARHHLAEVRWAGDDVLAAEALAVHRRALAMPPEVLADPEVRIELVALLEEQVVVLAGVPSPQAQELLAEVRALWSVLVDEPGFPGLRLPTELAPLPFAAATGLPSATALPGLAGEELQAPPPAAVAAPAGPQPDQPVQPVEPQPAPSEPAPSEPAPSEPAASEASPAASEASPAEPSEPAPQPEPEPSPPPADPAPAPAPAPGPVDPPTGLQEGGAASLLTG